MDQSRNMTAALVLLGMQTMAVEQEKMFQMVVARVYLLALAGIAFSYNNPIVISKDLPENVVWVLYLVRLHVKRYTHSPKAYGTLLKEVQLRLRPLLQLHGMLESTS